MHVWAINKTMPSTGNDKPAPPFEIKKVKTEIINQSHSKQLTDVNKQQEKEKNNHIVSSSNESIEHRSSSNKQQLLQSKKMVINKQLSNIGKQPTNVQNTTHKTQLLQSKKILINKALNNVGKQSISLQRVKKEKLKSDSFEQEHPPKNTNKNVNKQLTTGKNKQTETPNSITEESTGSDRENGILPNLTSRKKEQIDLEKVKNEKAAVAVASNNEIKCHRCDQSFEHAFEKIIHKKSVKGDGVPFVCEFCNFRSCTKDGLVIHQRAIHQKNTN